MSRHCLAVSVRGHERRHERASSTFNSGLDRLANVASCARRRQRPGHEARQEEVHTLRSGCEQHRSEAAPEGELEEVDAFVLQVLRHGLVYPPAGRGNTCSSICICSPALATTPAFRSTSVARGRSQPEKELMLRSHRLPTREPVVVVQAWTCERCARGARLTSSFRWKTVRWMPGCAYV